MQSFAKSAIEWRTFSSAVYFNKLSFSDARVHRPRSPRHCWAVTAFRRAIPLKKAMVQLADPKWKTGWAPLRGFTFAGVWSRTRASGETPELYRRHPAARGPLEGVKQSKIITFSKRVRWPYQHLLPNSQTVVVKVLLIQILPLYIFMYIWVANISYTMSLCPRRWWRKRSSRRVLPWTGRAPRWPTDGLFEWRWVKQYWFVEAKMLMNMAESRLSLGWAWGKAEILSWFSGWWFGICSSIDWEESSQLTNSYISEGVSIPPTRIINHPYWNSLYHL